MCVLGYIGRRPEYIYIYAHVHVQIKYLFSLHSGVKGRGEGERSKAEKKEDATTQANNYLLYISPLSSISSLYIYNLLLNSPKLSP